MLTILIIGLCVGLSLGLTGAGGGILAVPALMFSQNWSVAQAAPIGLLAITSAAIVGTVEGFLRQLVRYRAAIWIALMGIPMTPLGLYTAHRLPSHWLTMIFAVIMLVVAARLLIPSANNETYHPCNLNPDTGRLHWTWLTIFILGSIGMLTGFLTGLLGVGGGFILVPALRKATNLSMHSIVATSLMVIGLVGSGGIIFSLIQGHTFPVAVALPFIIACIIGMFGGRQLIHQFNAKTVQRGFAFFVICVAVFMLSKA